MAEGEKKTRLLNGWQTTGWDWTVGLVYIYSELGCFWVSRVVSVIILFFHSLWWGEVTAYAVSCFPRWTSHAFKHAHTKTHPPTHTQAVFEGSDSLQARLLTGKPISTRSSTVNTHIQTHTCKHKEEPDIHTLTDPDTCTHTHSRTQRHSHMHAHEHTLKNAHAHTHTHLTQHKRATWGDETEPWVVITAHYTHRTLSHHFSPPDTIVGVRCNVGPCGDKWTSIACPPEIFRLLYYIYFQNFILYIKALDILWITHFLHKPLVSYKNLVSEFLFITFFTWI